MRNLTALLGLLCAGISLSAPAIAQDFPAKPIKLVVPWPAGGTVDGVARVMQNRLAQGFGQPVVIDNKPGAGGSVGAIAVAQSPADGYTLLMVFDTHAVNHHLYRSQGLDPFKAFEHISRLVLSPQALVGANRFAPASVRELIAHAKAKPDSVNYGSVGTGSSNHLNMLTFNAQTGTRMVHVPYKGGAPMMQDLVAGQIDVMFVSAPQAIPQVAAGRIKSLAIGSQKRIAQLAETPAVAETLPGFEAASWVGLVAPKDTSQSILARVHKEFAAALAEKDVAEKLMGQGFEIIASTPIEFLDFVKSESVRLGNVITDNQIKVERARAVAASYSSSLLKRCSICKTSGGADVDMQDPRYEDRSARSSGPVFHVSLRPDLPC